MIEEEEPELTTGPGAGKYGRSVPEIGYPGRAPAVDFADRSLRWAYAGVPRQRLREVLCGQVQGGGHAAAAPEDAAHHVVVFFHSLEVLF